MEKNTIGDKIKKLRIQSKMTQEQFANKLHVTDGTVSKWERNKSVPDYETLILISKIFDVKVNYFLEDITLKNRIKHLLKITISFISKHWLVISLIIINILLFIYFILTINSFQMYELKIDDKNINIEDGYFIISKNKTVLNLSNITVNNIPDDIVNTKIKLYTYVNNERTDFFISDFETNILIKQFKGSEEYITKKISKDIPKYLHIEIELLRKDNTITSINAKISFKKVADSKLPMYRIVTLSNKKLGNNKELNESKIDNKNIANKLLNKGFKNINSTNTYYKKMKYYILYFDLDVSKMFYTNNNESVNYYFNSDKLIFLVKSTDADANVLYCVYSKGVINSIIDNCNNLKERYDEVINLYNNIIN